MVGLKKYCFIIVYFCSVCFIRTVFAADTSSKWGRVYFEKTYFNIEVARTSAELILGLQFRQSLKDNAGMLFIFPENGIYKFWMKDTLISLDMIWLDENGQVIYIQPDVSPCIKDPCPSYGPETASRYVLEIKSGQAKKYNIQVGNKAKINIPQRRS